MSSYSAVLSSSLRLAQETQAEYGTGLEWMLVASVVVPVVLLVLIFWYGYRNTV